MRFNVLIVGQSNADLLKQNESARIQASVQRLLGFDGVTDKVDMLASVVLGFPGSPLVPDGPSAVPALLAGSSGNFSAAGHLEQVLLNSLLALPAPDRAAPTVIVWVHNEADAENPDLTTATWLDAARYSVGRMREALGQGAATTPILFEPISYDGIRNDPVTNATDQRIKDGMAALVADPSFNAIQGPQAADTDMNLDVVGDGTSFFGSAHLSRLDQDFIATRLSYAVAAEFAADARPGSAFATSQGTLDAIGAHAWDAISVAGSPNQALVFFTASGGAALDGATASIDGWSMLRGGVEYGAIGARVVGANQLLLTFGTAVGGSTVYYGYGDQRISDTYYTGGQGHALRDLGGMPASAPLNGLAVDGPTASPLALPRQAPAPGLVSWTTPDGHDVVQASAAYSGGVDYLGSQFSLVDAGSVTLLSLTPNAFLVTGPGEDAIQVVGGNNVLDGGTGSNWLVGGTGQGSDTFFTDATLPGATWDTILNFHPGDSVTLWGFQAGASTHRWLTQADGAAGNQGATLVADMHGHGSNAQVTFGGITTAKAQRYLVGTGTQARGDYLSIRDLG